MRMNKITLLTNQSPSLILPLGRNQEYPSISMLHALGSMFKVFRLSQFSQRSDLASRISFHVLCSRLHVLFISQRWPLAAKRSRFSLLLLCSIFLFICSTSLAQDTTFVKSFYGGSTVKVPANKEWKIEKAYISANDGYNILISQKNFKEKYEAEETISFPYYIAEMELLSKKESVAYVVHIHESSK